MKKLILGIAVVFSVFVFAQRVQKGDLQLNAGVAADRYAGNVAFYAGLDYGIMPDITAGVEARIGGKDYNDYGYSYKSRWFGIAANANYHFNTLLKIPNKYDIYAGASVGYNSFNYDYPNGWNNGWGNKYNSEVGVSAQVGARYYFSEKFGVNAEANAGSLFNGGKLGISYKF